MNFTNHIVCSYVNQTLTSFEDPMTDIPFELFHQKLLWLLSRQSVPQKNCQSLRRILDLSAAVKIQLKL